MQENQAIVADAAQSAVPLQVEEIPIVFTGKGSEYFGIWIVNLLFSILTLGIYSAWAKVRRERYFHSHTLVDGSGFEYHGNPKSILKGRLIALGFFLAYHFSFQFSQVLGGIVLILLAALFPWLLVSSLRFRLNNASFRGLRFSFTGSVREGYRVFLLWPVLSVLTLYLLTPLAHQRLKHFQHDNIHFGTSRTSFDATSGSFYKIYFKTLGLTIALLILLVLLFSSTLGSAFSGHPNIKVLAPIFALGFFALLILFSLGIAPYFRARIQNLVWNNTRLGDLQTRSRVSARHLLRLQVTNFLGILFTLGLFIPFAAIRLTKYRLENMTLVAPSGLDHFLAGEPKIVHAVGDETAEMFDLDIGL